MHASIINPMKNVGDFIFWNRKFEKIFGYLDDIEGYALKLFAENGPGEGEVVEIGSFMGRSTCWLAAGVMHKNSAEKVIAIDHFRGSSEHQPGHTCECKALLEKGTTFDAFAENLKSVELDTYVTPYVGASEDIVRNWSKPIRLLFIDGDHSFEASQKDFNLWSPFVIPGGIVIFHDIGQWKGVTGFYRQLMQMTNQYKPVMGVSSLRVIIKSHGI